MLKDRSDDNKNNILIMGITFVAVVVLFIIIQAASGLYPFGSRSNLLWDQDIQYVDYFAFYKDVLLGKANLGYSFSKSMGGSLIALFGYYLGCPLNVFVVFFSKAQIPLFLFILNAVKLGLAGCTAQYFFSRRFPKLSSQMRIWLAVSYGLAQYVIYQSSNIMWLDGVILLPLLLLAAYRFITEGRKMGLFIGILCCILINWYTGYMIILFTIAYFVYERLLVVEQKKGEWKRVFLDLIRFGFTVGCGVLGSCFLFYPIFKGLQNGKQVFDSTIFTPYVNGTPLDILRGYSVGSVVPVVSLYCGILTLGFFVYYFLSGRIAIKEKILSVLATGFMLVSCWFVPLECIWSGFRYAGAYRYRYSFVVVFLLLYLAAKGAHAYEAKKDNVKLSVIYLFFVPVFFCFHFHNKFNQSGILITAIVLGIYSVLFLVMKFKRNIGVLVSFVLAVELVINGIFTFQIYYSQNPDISEYKEYVANSENQVEVIQEQEKDNFYRMDTLQKRYDTGDGRSAFLNESMAYAYRGINHYSSTYDTALSDMLYNIGISTEYDLSIYSESILPVDSLFGIKYLLSKAPVAGYGKREDLPKKNGKSVYQNPHALGVGMYAADSVYESIDSLNPFEYQNQLFSNLLGRDVQLYKKVEMLTTIADQVLTLQIPSSGEKNLLYGYVNTWIEDLPLFVDGEYRCDYASWLSYKTFHVGDASQDHFVTLNGYTGTEEDMEPYFYSLNQKVFENIMLELKEKEMVTTIFEDGHVEGAYLAEEAGHMLLTIPYDTGWKAYVNSAEVEIKQAADALMAVPVERGENEIVLKYQIPGLGEGTITSVVGILLFLVFCLMERKGLKTNLGENKE